MKGLSKCDPNPLLRREEHNMPVLVCYITLLKHICQHFFTSTWPVCEKLAFIQLREDDLKSDLEGDTIFSKRLQMSVTFHALKLIFLMILITRFLWWIFMIQRIQIPEWSVYPPTPLKYGYSFILILGYALVVLCIEGLLRDFFLKALNFFLCYINNRVLTKTALQESSNERRTQLWLSEFARMSARENASFPVKWVNLFCKTLRENKFGTSQCYLFGVTFQHKTTAESSHNRG